MKLSDNIKRLRIQNNLTQQELADAVFVSRSAIANYENGKRTPDIDTLLLLAKIFNVSLKELVVEESIEEVNLVKDEIINVDVLNKKKHRNLVVPIINIALTIALVISLAFALVPTIKSKINYNNIDNINMEEVERIDMVLYIDRQLFYFSFEQTNYQNQYILYAFNIKKYLDSNKTGNNYYLIFYITVSLKNHNFSSFKSPKYFGFDDNCKNMFIPNYEYDCIYFYPEGTFDIILYYQNNLWYIETYFY